MLSGTYQITRMVMDYILLTVQFVTEYLVQTVSMSKIYIFSHTCVNYFHINNATFWCLSRNDLHINVWNHFSPHQLFPSYLFNTSEMITDLLCKMNLQWLTVVMDHTCSNHSSTVDYHSVVLLFSLSQILCCSCIYLSNPVHYPDKYPEHTWMETVTLAQNFTDTITDQWHASTWT